MYEECEDTFNACNMTIGRPITVVTLLQVHVLFLNCQKNSYARNILKNVSALEINDFILYIRFCFQQGEGVPATRKGACANHVKDINRFFKVHCRR